jgi:4-amino-4-deoxychorismate mutase
MRKLEEYRREIDGIDEGIVGAFAKRISLCKEIAQFKKEHDIPMMQPERVAAVLARCATLAARHGIDPAFLTGIYTLVIEETCKIETDVMLSGGKANNTLGRPRL